MWYFKCCQSFCVIYGGHVCYCCTYKWICSASEEVGFSLWPHYAQLRSYFSWEEGEVISSCFRQCEPFLLHSICSLLHVNPNGLTTGYSPKRRKWHFFKFICISSGVFVGQAAPPCSHTHTCYTRLVLLEAKCTDLILVEGFFIELL